MPKALVVGKDGIAGEVWDWELGEGDIGSQWDTLRDDVVI